MGVVTCRVVEVWVVAEEPFCLKIFFLQQQQMPAGMPMSSRRARRGFSPMDSW